MCQQHPVAEPIDPLEDTAFGAVAYGVDRRLMLHLLMRALVDPDNPEVVGDLRTYLNNREPAVSAARAELLADLPAAAAPSRGAEVVPLPAGIGGRPVR